MTPMIPACLAPRDVSRPKVSPPPNACDTHAHVFGPAARFRYADDRSYTPPDAPLEKYLDMLDSIGFARGVLVQGSAHGRDNSAMLDALAHRPDRLRPFHEALVRANPERLVWGGDWPHPRVEGEMPDAGHLFELFQLWTPDQATQHRILVTNPAKLYDFPN
ncbi:MAG TPA: amidohydrolase family protein [Bradyrhizobium sp.]|nr:amidohydrolase family protein [Bradyrhizobium sp.]